MLLNELSDKGGCFSFVVDLLFTLMAPSELLITKVLFETILAGA